MITMKGNGSKTKVLQMTFDLYSFIQYTFTRACTSGSFIPKPEPGVIGQNLGRKEISKICVDVPLRFVIWAVEKYYDEENEKFVLALPLGKTSFPSLSCHHTADNVWHPKHWEVCKFRDYRGENH